MYDLKYRMCLKFVKNKVNSKFKFLLISMGDTKTFLKVVRKIKKVVIKVMGLCVCEKYTQIHLVSILNDSHLHQEINFLV